MNEMFSSALEWLGVMLQCGIVVFALGSIFWAFYDSDERVPRWGCAVAILVALTWPWGLLLYLILRRRLVPAVVEGQTTQPSL